MNRNSIQIRRIGLTVAIAALVAGCGSMLGQDELIRKARQDPNSLLIVDCALPPRVVNQGLAMVYLSASQPIKTTAIDCGIRGGKYVAYDRANYATALNVWLEQAKTGNAEAQTNVGEIYDKGLGLPPDYATAIQWYEKAAAQGHTRAQINLGYLYEKGLGVPKNLATALNWYRKASGLTDDSLAFTSSIEVGGSAEITQARAEIQSLRSELAGSRQEIETLRQRLGTSEGELEQDRNRLRETLESLEKTKAELERARRAPLEQQRQDLPRLDQELKDKQARADAEAAALKRRQAQFQQANTELLNKLAKAERRASEMNARLDQKKFETTRLETKLAQTTADLEQVKLDYAARQQNLAAPAADTGQRKELEARLGQREQELQAQRNRIAELEKKMETVNRDKQALERQAGGTHEQELGSLSQQLARVTGELKSEKDRAGHLEQEVGRLTAERQTQAPGRQKELEAQLAQREQALRAQLNRVAELEKKVAEVNRDKQTLAQQQASGAQKRDQSLEAISRQLTQVMGELKDEKDRAGHLEQEVGRLMTERQSQASSSATAESVKDEQLKHLAKKINDYTKAMAQLREQLQQAQSRAAPAAALPTSAASGGPRIEVIDPPLAVTRGMPTVKLRAIVPARSVTGNIQAPAGIKSFIINDRTEKVSDTGMFKADIPLSGKETPVNITLIDNRAGKASLDFLIVSPDRNEAAPPAPAPASSASTGLDFGRYHALIIGNNRYTQAGLPALDTPVNDATAISKLLKERYGFETTLLTNATRYDILTALNQLRDKLKEKDNLIIYYAGHGELDKVNLRGQWLPVDAERGNTANWISTDAVTDILNTIPARHIMVVADSCYSGAMTRAALALLEPNVPEAVKTKWLTKMLEHKSRTVLTSGGLEPVLDAGSDGHSVFAKAFLDTLQKNREILSGQALFRDVSEQVRRAAERFQFEQVPLYAPIRHTDHEASDFFFVPKEHVATLD